MSTEKTSSQGNIPDSRGINFYTSDPGMAALLPVYLGQDQYQQLQPQLRDLGQRVSEEVDDWALAADKNPPVLAPRTRTGQAIQRIIKHPSYEALERVAYGELGLAALSHCQPKPPALVKYALTFLFVQAEFGLCCPVSMTDSLTRTLCKFGSKALIDRYLPALTARDLDSLAQGAMFMTEQAAGSDVARISTLARQEGDIWRLTGDKWFCSNADADLAMVLAHAEGAPDGIKGLALFLLPRTLADGSPNHYRIVRLKDKMGSRSMASGEIVLEGAEAYLVGEVGRGFHQMADMINNSRLSNGVRAAGLMRRAVTEALYVARHRQAFGRRLIEMPLMQRQLLKLLLPAEQARSFFMHIATCLDRADQGDAIAAKLMRILTPLIKFRACRDARRVTGDAMEVRGGVGYIEEWSDPRLVRDAHLGSIWEGTSNIVALDVLRAIKRDQALDPLASHLKALLDDSGLPEQSRALFDRVFKRVMDLTHSANETGNDEVARQVASALYSFASAVFMAWEASRMGDDHRRLALAHLVIRHRLLPQDPLASEANGTKTRALAALLEERALTHDEALALLP